MDAGVSAIASSCSRRADPRVKTYMTMGCNGRAYLTFDQIIPSYLLWCGQAPQGTSCPDDLESRPREKLPSRQSREGKVVETSTSQYLTFPRSLLRNYEDARFRLLRRSSGCLMAGKARGCENSKLLCMGPCQVHGCLFSLPGESWVGAYIEYLTLLLETTRPISAATVMSDDDDPLVDRPHDKRVTYAVASPWTSLMKTESLRKLTESYSLFQMTGLSHYK